MFPIVRVAPISSPITHGPWFDGNRVSSRFQLLAVYLAGSMSVVGMVFGLLFLGIKNAIYIYIDIGVCGFGQHKQWNIACWYFGVHFGKWI